MITLKHFSLKHTLESGQFFRYAKKRDWYYCQEGSKVFKIRQQGSKIEYKGTTKEHIKKLFGLGDNYSKIIRKLSEDETLRTAVQKHKGLRLMNRDPWETIINFQCSMMSNIPKIKKNMELISRHFGSQKKFEGSHYHTFPKPGQINDINLLKKSLVGFRAKYIHGANKQIDAKFIKQLKKQNFQQAKAQLMRLPGVGPKIADCVCLFALGKKEAFPIDVWIERVMKDKYGIQPKQVNEFARKRWGENAGYAQQFLYHDARNR